MLVKSWKDKGDGMSAIPKAWAASSMLTKRKHEFSGWVNSNLTGKINELTSRKQQALGLTFLQLGQHRRRQTERVGLTAGPERLHQVVGSQQRGPHSQSLLTLPVIQMSSRCVVSLSPNSGDEVSKNLDRAWDSGPKRLPLVNIFLPLPTQSLLTQHSMTPHFLPRHI